MFKRLDEGNANRITCDKVGRCKPYDGTGKRKGIFKMNDTYVEWLVKRKNSAVGTACKGLGAGLTVVSVLAMLSISGIFFFAAVIFGVFTYFAFIRSDVEYEYLYLDREITVDKIMGKSKRKRVAKFNMDKMELIAPYRSHHLDSYQNRGLKVEDYSSCEEKQPDGRYMMVYSDEGSTKLVVLEPNQAMIAAIKTIAPRKVMND